MAKKSLSEQLKEAKKEISGLKKKAAVHEKAMKGYAKKAIMSKFSYGLAKFSKPWVKKMHSGAAYGFGKKRAAAARTAAAFKRRAGVMEERRLRGLYPITATEAKAMEDHMNEFEREQAESAAGLHGEVLEAAGEDEAQAVGAKRQRTYGLAAAGVSGGNFGGRHALAYHEGWPSQ